MSYTGSEPKFLTQPQGDNSTKAATTAYVDDAFSYSISSINITSLDIDWSLGNIFYKSISANSTFTFSNVTDGKTISVVVTNTSGAAVTITIPIGIKVPSGFILSIPAGKSNVYTFMVANSIIYASYVDGLV